MICQLILFSLIIKKVNLQNINSDFILRVCSSNIIFFHLNVLKLLEIYLAYLIILLKIVKKNK